jgi:hypothetical protein
MADYFTNFSLIVPLPTEAAEKYALDLAHQAFHIHMGEDMPGDFPASLRDVAEDWQFDTDPSDPANGWGLWLHSSDGGIDAVCAFIQHLLERFDPTGHAGLEWSNDCSKPRVDAFGGGAAVITAIKIKHISTGQWLHRQVARLQTHKPAAGRWLAAKKERNQNYGRNS